MAVFLYVDTIDNLIERHNNMNMNKRTQASALIACLLVLSACGSSPSSSGVTEGKKTTNMTGVCADYLAKTEDIMANAGEADSKMKEMTEKNIAKMKADWSNMSAEQQAQANKGCQMLLDKLGDMLDNAAGMPASQ